MTYQQFRKKPVTIEAIQWTGENLRDVITFTDGPPDTRSRHAGMAWENYEDLVRRDGLKIFTLEGAMLASPGDWIIRGVKGEYYPCKPGIFEATYEPAAIEAPVQEPVAWGESYDGGKTFVSCTVTAGSKHHTFPLYATPADAEAHLTALLRAEYERGKAETQTGERVQHVKRGSSYTVVGRGKVQTDTPLTDYAEVVIYRGDDAQVWVRPVSEFEDGRFAILKQEVR